MKIENSSYILKDFPTRKPIKRPIIALLKRCYFICRVLVVNLFKLYYESANIIDS